MKQLTSILCIGATALACNARTTTEGPSAEKAAHEETQRADQPADERKTVRADQAAKAEAAKPSQAETERKRAVVVENVGVFRPANELRNAIDRTVSVADANGDGKISRAEASGAMNFVLGGFFFRADENGDGKITKEERKQARAAFAEQHPEVERMLTAFAETAAVQEVMKQLDADVEQTLELKQARSTIGNAVDGIFDALDENNDRVITALEADQAFNVFAAEMGRAAFERADVDNDGHMTFEEMQKSAAPALRQIFEAADNDDNGKLSETEAASMMSWLAERMDLMAERGYDWASRFTETSMVTR